MDPCQLRGRDNAIADENRVDLGHGGRWQRCWHGLLDECMLQSSPPRFGCSRGHPRSANSGSVDGGFVRAILHLGGIVLELVLAGGDKRRSGVASTASTTMDLGNVKNGNSVYCVKQSVRLQMRYVC